MDKLFIAIGRTVARHRWKIVAIWVVLLGFGMAFAPRLHEVFERQVLQGNAGDSAVATDTITREFPTRSAFQSQLVLTSDSKSVDDPAYRQAALAMTAVATGTGRVRSTESYFDAGDRFYVSQSGRTTRVVLNLTSTTCADAVTASDKLLAAVGGASKPDWLKADITGAEAIQSELGKASTKSIATAESVGLPIALIVLVVVFGALVAAGLPLIMGVISIVIVLGLAFVVGQWIDLSVYLETAATMLGLGLGIDYSLFMLTRYRSERKAGRSVEAAVVETVRHAGKAIAFSGFTVAIGTLALLVAASQAVVSVGIGGVLVALVAVAAALTLLPATIALLGDRIEQPAGLTRLVGRAHRGGFWANWARGVMRHPVRSLLAGLAVIAVLAWPATTLRTSDVGAKVIGDDAQSRQGYEILNRDFGPGLTSPVQIVVRSPSGIDDPRTVAGIADLTAAIKADSRFAGAVSITALDPRLKLPQYQALYANKFAGVPAPLRPQLARLVNLSRAGDTTIVLGLLAVDSASDQAAAAIRDLRGTVIPAINNLSGDSVYVGGTTANQLDSTDLLYGRFPIVVAIILAATFVLLMVLFRSILIPLKAVIMNLLSVGASYGLLVVAFQNGWGEKILGFTSTGSIYWITPVLVFAVLFGLSMDYEVFLLSRIRELHDRGLSNEDAIAGGLERTGGVITGAAVIMIVVFAAFTLSSLLPVKELGFSLAAAVLIDATVVRIILVPAALRLLGDWSWKLPAWLSRILPNVELEPEIVAPADRSGAPLGPLDGQPLAPRGGSVHP